jgi:ribonuclease HII
VVAAACVVQPDVTLHGIMDSKKMKEEARDSAYEAITNTPGIRYGMCASIVYEQPLLTVLMDKSHGHADPGAAEAS